MTRIIMRGCNGHMGRVIADLVKEDAAAEIVAGIDLTGQSDRPFPVYESLKDVKEEADVLIDFTSPKLLTELLKDAEELHMPLVLCSTGYTKEQIEEIKEASAKLPILRSANMSLGVNVLLKLVKAAAEVLGSEGYDIEIIEKHHRLKLDAPSGTALAIADAINDALPERYEYVYDRSGRREQRPKKEIGISALRGGTIVGEHEIYFAGTDEVIEIRHTAYSKAIFGKGAVAAAKFLAGREPGLYTMQDAVDLQ
ncbi:MAG: 4-hydroxy-tetrahydrodipicolinate reductase [Lachnospiraceae bacterium]|nr:4-hydroxy-tetrahydrodipicolinate reductase [Lachnospiraceae bacterium]MBO4669802.1 4-hydroxy-tetrahydrodipicolinate reductase [Lachnospiraceae bacterium]MBR5667337.1 4-hydroxy-tetrahydrodipicolinate reductase [Lachnospiraceae bacterium]